MKIIISLTVLILMIFAGCERKASEQTTQDLLLQDLLREPAPIESATQSAPEPAAPLTQDSTTAQPAAANKKKARAASGVVEIREKMFIAQTNDIYINKDDYLGRTIKYEGLFDESVWRGNGKTYRYVIRFGPGCCPGDAAAAGFEVVWDRGYPKKNDWVEAVGVLQEYDDDGIPSLRLALTSLSVLAKRGKEKVTQ